MALGSNLDEILIFIFSQEIITTNQSLNEY